MRTVKLKKSTPRKPWITQDLLQLILKGNVYLNSESQEVFSNFKNFVMKLIGFTDLAFKNTMG